MNTLEMIDLKNPRVKKVVNDILSQAITGELIGMSNFASLAETIDDYHEKMEAVEHAESERQHAIGFIEIAEKYDFKPIINLEGIYWDSMRTRFLKHANRSDFIACLIIQEVMLESFAVSMYRDTGEALDGDIGSLLLETSNEEKEHLEHSSELLRKEYERTGEAFVEKFHNLHIECMTILAEWAATEDLQGHCGVCDGTCMKDDLEEIGLTTSELRANALNTYARALDDIGLPTEQTTGWIINLPS